jgi:hypothetical protein
MPPSSALPDEKNAGETGESEFLEVPLETGFYHFRLWEKSG